MRSKWIYILLIMCYSSVPMYSQISATHYQEMCSIIMDSLSIDDAYISDSLHEHEILATTLYNMGIRKELPFVNPYEDLRTEYSAILHSNFKTLHSLKGNNTNLIFFSIPEGPFISAYAYIGVKTSNRKYIFPFPMWGYYKEWYVFIFQIKDNGVILLNKQQVYEM